MDVCKQTLEHCTTNSYSHSHANGVLYGGASRTRTDNIISRVCKALRTQRHLSLRDINSGREREIETTLYKRYRNKEHAGRMRRAKELRDAHTRCGGRGVTRLNRQPDMNATLLAGGKRGGTRCRRRWGREDQRPSSVTNCPSGGRGCARASPRHQWFEFYSWTFQNLN